MITPVQDFIHEAAAQHGSCTHLQWAEEGQAGKKRLQSPPLFVGMLRFTIYGEGLASAVKAAASLPLLIVI